MSATPTAYTYWRQRALDWVSLHDGIPRQDIRNLLIWAERQPDEIDEYAAGKGAYQARLDGQVLVHE